MHFASGECPGNAEIARAVNRTGPWLTKWAKSAKPPRDYEVHAPLAAFLGVERDWLIDGKGEAPGGALWAAWLKEHGFPADAAERDVPVAASALFQPVPKGAAEAKRKTK